MTSKGNLSPGHASVGKHAEFISHWIESEPLIRTLLEYQKEVLSMLKEVLLM